MEELNLAQISGLIGLGALYGGAAALKIRSTGHILYANNMSRISNYMTAIPVGYIAIRFGEVLFQIDPRKRLISTSIMSATDLLLDGITFMWFPSLYENPSLQDKNSPSSISVSRMGAAWLLWGVGTCLTIALIT